MMVMRKALKMMGDAERVTKDGDDANRVTNDGDAGMRKNDG